MEAMMSAVFFQIRVKSDMFFGKYAEVVINDKSFDLINESVMNTLPLSGVYY